MKTSAVMKNCTSQGVTLVSNGWTSVTNQPIINILVVSSEGPTFLSSVDTSGNEKTAEYIAALLGERIAEVGQDKVVQVVMDSAVSCAAAGKLIEEKNPSIVCSPCCAHCLDLLFEDIGKQQWISFVIQQGRDIVKFVTTPIVSGILSVARKSGIAETRSDQICNKLHNVAEIDAVQKGVTGDSG
jgi:hypothetical protein